MEDDLVTGDLPHRRGRGQFRLLVEDIDDYKPNIPCLSLSTPLLLFRRSSAAILVVCDAGSYQARDNWLLEQGSIADSWSRP